MNNVFKGKNILITGAAGSFGGALTEHMLKAEPGRIRVFDHDEEALFHMQQRYRDEPCLRYFLGDIRSKERLRRAMEGVDIVVHCAALKHVYSCEYNPFEAVETNVIGTQNVIEVAMDEEVERFMFTSSDKAANPTNVMGTTKLLGEKLVVSANHYKGARNTIFSAVRFGNVMGSSGSVIPLFDKQVREGGPVTLTDAGMTRFVISLEQAVSLVVESIGKAHGGEVFIMKMPSLNISDLAEVMRQELAPKYGRKSADIKIDTIGVKAGEKMYEELMSTEELSRSVEYGDFYVILPQLRELYDLNASNYKHAKKPAINSASSNDVPLLSKKEIASLLRKEGYV